MPIGNYPDFDSCIREQRRNGKSIKSAKRICGYLEKKLNKGVEAQDAIDKYNKVRGKDDSVKGGQL